MPLGIPSRTFPSDIAIMVCQQADIIHPQYSGLKMSGGGVAQFQGYLDLDEDEREELRQETISKIIALGEFQKVSMFGDFESAKMAWDQAVEGTTEEQYAALKAVHEFTPVWALGEVSEKIFKFIHDGCDGKTLALLADVLVKIMNDPSDSDDNNKLKADGKKTVKAFMMRLTNDGKSP